MLDRRSLPEDACTHRVPPTPPQHGRRDSWHQGSKFQGAQRRRRRYRIADAYPLPRKFPCNQRCVHCLSERRREIKIQGLARARRVNALGDCQEPPCGGMGAHHHDRSWRFVIRPSVGYQRCAAHDRGNQDQAEERRGSGETPQHPTNQRHRTLFHSSRWTGHAIGLVAARTSEHRWAIPAQKLRRRTHSRQAARSALPAFHSPRFDDYVVGANGSEFTIAMQGQG